jgi:hypothetical protein
MEGLELSAVLTPRSVAPGGSEFHASEPSVDEIQSDGAAASE